MNVLVAYASKHGSTRAIAERIAARIGTFGLDAELRSTDEVATVEPYDAVVLGSAVYFGSWMQPAVEFVNQHRAVLASRALWLFSSGPLGTRETDDQGRDLREITVPRQIPEIASSLEARGHRVFFGALDHGTMTFGERLLRTFPPVRALLQHGDFRDWDEIDGWADEIAAELMLVTSAP